MLNFNFVLLIMTEAHLDSINLKLYKNEEIYS